MAYSLSVGTHRPNPRRYCALELLSVAAGETWSDRPAGVDPLLAAVVRTLNDTIRSRSVRTALLLPYLLRDVADHRHGPGRLHGTDDACRGERARIVNGLFGDRWAEWLTYYGASVTHSTYHYTEARRLLDRLVDPGREPVPVRYAAVRSVPAQRVDDAGHLEVIA